jgi:hypothetical protein
MIIFRGAMVAYVNWKSFLLRSRSVETTIFAQHACLDSLVSQAMEKPLTLASLSEQFLTA